MLIDQGIIAVDWGTTNRRAYAIDRKGEFAEPIIDGQGVTSVPAGGFPAAVAELRAKLGERPMLLAGMIGSNRGWREAAYLGCPVDLASLGRSLTRVEGADAAIIPGVCDTAEGRADVMRGEEIQLLGAVAAGLIAPDAAVCHPGTHAKWVRMRGGSIAAFRTVMTGELFALLRKHSILADLLGDDVTTGPAFLEGVRQGYEDAALSADLFSVRARVLLGKLDRADAGSRVSGLLIGSDLRIGRGFVGADEAIDLIGDPTLTALYAAGLRALGGEAREIDGEVAFLAGVRALAETMS